MEDCNNFLEKIKKFKSYIVEFEKNDAIKKKIYLFDYAVHDPNRRLIIVITYNKCTFFANNGI